MKMRNTNLMVLVTTTMTAAFEMEMEMRNDSNGFHCDTNLFGVSTTMSNSDLEAHWG